jgi:cyclic pyranopterin phosphate synthase
MLSHIDKNGLPTMLDVGHKPRSFREAKARSRVFLPSSILEAFSDGEIQTKKGPVFQTAIIAGTMAAKKTSELIPFCHPLPIDSCKIEISLKDGNYAEVIAHLSCEAKTGIEMEALVAASTAALTIYDMCKCLSHEVRIESTELLLKRGGKSDYSHDSI